MQIGRGKTLSLPTFGLRQLLYQVLLALDLECHIQFPTQQFPHSAPSAGFDPEYTGIEGMPS